MLAEDTDCCPTHWDHLPRSVDVPDGQNEQGVPREITITDRELQPLIPAEKNVRGHSSVTQQGVIWFKLNQRYKGVHY